MSVHLCMPTFVWVCECVCVQVRGGVREGLKGDVGTNESTGAVGAVCLL